MHEKTNKLNCKGLNIVKYKWSKCGKEFKEKNLKEHMNNTQE